MVSYGQAQTSVPAAAGLSQSFQARNGLTTIAFSPDGKTLATVGNNNRIILWDVVSSQERMSIPVQSAAITAVAFAPDGMTLAGVGDNGQIKLWNVVTGLERRTLFPGSLGTNVNEVAFSPNAKVLASIGNDSRVIVWDVTTGNAKQVLFGHSDVVNGVAFSSDGKILASGGQDSTIILWDMESGQERATLRSLSGAAVNQVAFSPDGNTLASVSEDSLIRLWDVANGELQQTLAGNANFLTQAAYSPNNSNLLASVDNDTNINLWNLSTGQIGLTLSGKPGITVNEVAFSPDGKILASAGDDKRLILWDVNTGKVSSILSAASDSVAAVAFSSDQKTLATVAKDGQIIVWDIATGDQRLISLGPVPVTSTATLVQNSPQVAFSAGTANVGATVAGNPAAANVAKAADVPTATIAAATAAVDCGSPANPIVAENCLPGNPSTEWDISGAGDASIQGFATDISVNRGATVSFKVNTAANNYRLDIYRMGYYGGLGARKITTIQPSVTLPQTQPSCLTNASTGLFDCGNWALSASWTVPTDATSGIYFAKLVRTDNGGASHIVFIVRDDASNSDLLFQTADTTWQAYNNYGGNSLYTGGPVGYAYKVSYNRPFNTRAVENGQDWLFNAEYPMVRWLEANGYNVSYITGIDSDRFGSLIRNHKVFLSIGHDEYWSGAQRTNVEAARAAGVHLGFFSGNEVFWKTRWENSIAGTSTPYRTLVCYKETHQNAAIDPLDTAPTWTWTGTWRDPRFSPPADGRRPENALTGTIFTVNFSTPTDAIKVPEADGKMRFWRNTSVATLASGAVATLPNGTLGYEWDEELDNGSRPNGLIRLSSATYNGVSYLQDYGSSYAAGTATHHLTLYRHNSGALIFGAGTPQWSWGLDSNHDRGSALADVRMQQATVNLLADMSVQAANLQSGLTAAAASTDVTAPTSTINAPANGSTIPTGSQNTITGTATDSGGGVIGGIEVSVDGGTTWHPANGRANWSYSWAASVSGSVTIKSRAADDSGNLETPSAGVTVTVGSGGGGSCNSNCTIWTSTAVPVLVDPGPNSAVEVGLKFRSDVSGSITGIRFYKASANTGTHVGNLWSSSGVLLASATFTGETGSGWQQVSFATPVSITANTVYVASYHTDVGHYSFDVNYFTSSGVDNAPLHALADGVSGSNGVYAFGASSAFPVNGYSAFNGWVDVVFSSGPPPTLASIAVTPANPTILTGTTQQFTATGTYSNGSTQNITGQVTWSSSSTAVATIGAATGLAMGVSTGNTTISAALSGVSGSSGLTVQAGPLNITTASLSGGTLGVAYSATLAASGGTPPYMWSIASGSLPGGLSLTTATGAITGTPTAAGTFSFTVQATDSANPVLTSPIKALSITIAAIPVNFTIWPSTAVPVLVDPGPNSAVEVGVKFRSDVSGSITGIRFYKASANTGTHVGNLWSSSGVLLASATFTGETGSGWQQVSFTTPVSITANTVYVASYHTDVGHYSFDVNYFTSSGVDNAPLHALADGVSGSNGVYAFGASSVFPVNGFSAFNGWVDVVFSSGPQPLSIATTSLPSGTVGIAYSATLAASGGTPPYTPWSINTGALPAGMSLNFSTGVISGTPSVAGTSSFTLQVNDSTGATVTKPLSIVVANGITSTSFLAPSANAPVTISAGDINGFEATPANAYVSDGLFAVDANSGTNTNTTCTNTGKDKHNYYNYNFSLPPTGVTIRGIEVQLKAMASSTTNSPFMCVQLSWNGGTTWTTTQSTTTLSTTNATYTLGGTANTWGRTWSAGDFSNTNFRIRISDVAASTARTFSLDSVAVRVTYQ